MKRILTILSIVALAAVLTAPAQAGKGKKGAAAGDAPKAGKILKEYDKNADGKIDGDEATALRKAFDGGDAGLKGLDTDKDGKLSDGEIAAIKGHKKKDK